MKLRILASWMIYSRGWYTLSSCKYEILTDRDKKILELVEQLKVVDVFTVDNILFKNTKCNRVCQRRLTN